jgi:hypothetical protein
MKYKLILICTGLFLLGKTHAQVVFARIDSTLKIGKAGYKVDCRNKSVASNQLTIRPVGMESDAKEMSFPIKGRVASAQVDDLNSDGYPDLLLVIYTDSNAIFGTAWGFISEANKAIVPAVLADPMMDPKINTGYKGHDQISLMEGSLLQKFPIYKTGDDKDHPTGGTRVVMYRLARGESGGYKFAMTRTFDTK